MITSIGDQLLSLHLMSYR